VAVPSCCLRACHFKRCLGSRPACFRSWRFVHPLSVWLQSLHFRTNRLCACCCLVSLCLSPVFSNNAMVLPTAIHQLLCAAHKVSLRFLKPVSSRDIISLHCDVPRMPSYLHWLHMFVKIASTSCGLRTADCEAKRTSFFRERSTEYEAAGLLLEEVRNHSHFGVSSNPFLVAKLSTVLCSPNSLSVSAVCQQRFWTTGSHFQRSVVLSCTPRQQSFAACPKFG
jgi:hypothetical protein